MSFHWRGRTKEGVSRWIGNWNPTLRWLGLGFSFYGAIAGCAGVCFLFYALIHSWPKPFDVLTLVFLLHGVIFGGSGAWMLSMRRHILALSTIRQVGEYLGTDEVGVQRMITERSIKPRININGQDLYDVHDFIASPLRIR